MKADKISKIGIVMIFAAWGLFLGLLTYFFHNWYMVRENPNKRVQSLVLQDGSRQIILKANYQSQFFANGFVNKQRATFLIDTGATHVVISEKLAKALKLKVGTKVLAKTAGGDSFVRTADLNEIQIGNIKLRHVPAVVSKDIDEAYILLGMSALKHLDLERKNNTLTLTLPFER